MRYYISQFGTSHLIIFLICFKALFQCFVITPRTIPDTIELYNSSLGHNKSHDLNTVILDKSWLTYINAILKKLLSECSLGMIKSQFSPMQQCIIYFSVSYKIIKKSCPASNKSRISMLPVTTFQQEQVVDVKPDKIIVGIITISTTKCPMLLDLWLSVQNQQIITETIYKFQMDPVLRLNITLLHIEL